MYVLNRSEKRLRGLEVFCCGAIAGAAIESCARVIPGMKGNPNVTGINGDIRELAA